MYQTARALRVLEVQLCAFAGKLDVSTDGSRDVIAALTTFARLARAVCEAFAVSLHADDVVASAGLLIGHIVAAEAVDANAGFDGARFVDCLFECRGCGELNHRRCLRESELLT